MLREDFKTRVLVADGDSTSTAYLELVLRNGGYSVQSAKTAPGALRMFQAFQPDLVLIDTAFSESGGLAILRRMIRLAPELKIEPRFIVLTSEDRRYEREQAAAVGAVEYLVKPVQPTALLKCIEDVSTIAPAV